MENVIKNVERENSTNKVHLWTGCDSVNTYGRRPSDRVRLFIQIRDYHYYPTTNENMFSEPQDAKSSKMFHKKPDMQIWMKCICTDLRQSSCYNYQKGFTTTTPPTNVRADHFLKLHNEGKSKNVEDQDSLLDRNYNAIKSPPVAPVCTMPAGDSWEADGI